MPHLSISFVKTFLASRFISNETVFFLIDHILSETICLSCFCTLFSNIYHKFKFMAKIGPTSAISIVNWIFGKKKIRKYVLFFFTDFEKTMFYNHIVKISELLNEWNLLKTCIQTTYPIDIRII